MNKNSNLIVLHRHADKIVITFECRQYKPNINLVSFNGMVDGIWYSRLLFRWNNNACLIVLLRSKILLVTEQLITK